MICIDTTISNKTQLQLFFYVIYLNQTPYILFYTLLQKLLSHQLFSQSFIVIKKHNKAQFVNKFRYMWRDISCMYLLQALYCSKTLYSKIGKKHTFIEWKREKNILFFLNKHINYVLKLQKSFFFYGKELFHIQNEDKYYDEEEKRFFLFI